GYIEVIKANLDIFFIEFIRQSSNPHSNAKSRSTYAQERFEEFIELISTHITTHKQVSQYADLLNLSTYQVNSITKASVGKLASELINEQIVLEAKRYLLATHNQVKDIADHLGYEDISYFIRFFKKQTGYSPESFRKNFL
ncbi:MAG: AraC family transcriptional regulator, partial [Bacteroidota bacterium]